MLDKSKLIRIRFALGVFIFLLVLSGITAYPILTELNLLVSILGLNENSQGIGKWVWSVQQGLTDSYEKYSWIGYGTDWLAFGHIVIAVFFIGALINPVQNIWIIKAGIIACLMVVPQAFISGSYRGIPFGWQLIDCSFGVFGIIPLIYCIKILEKNQ